MTSASSFVPCSSVRPKLSSSERAHSMIASRSRSSSGYAAPMISMTFSAKTGMKPGCIPMRLPCWIARRMIRRRM